MFFEADIIRYCGGNMPVIITSQHDGNITSLDCIELPMVYNVANDIGTRDLVTLMARFSNNIFYRPFFLIYKVQKSRSSWNLYERYLLALSHLAKRVVIRYGKCLVIDIHRFHARPVCQEQQDCDFIFGTNWRNSVDDNVDIKFGHTLQLNLEKVLGRSYKVFIPPNEEIEGARFGATGKVEGRIIQSKWLRDEVFGVSTIQVEIFKDLLVKRFRQAISTAFLSSLVQLSR